MCADIHCVILNVRVPVCRLHHDLKSFQSIGEAEYVERVSEWRLGLGAVDSKGPNNHKAKPDRAV